jgi:hypothetical protein
MDSETNYDIIPVNNSCKNVINNSSIVSSQGSSTSYSNQNITNINNQHAADSQYDNVDNLQVKPLYGGKNKIINNKLNFYTIKFRNKIVNIEAFNKKNAIKIFTNRNINNKLYKTDNILEVIYKNKNSLYILSNKNNKNYLIRII